MRLFYNPGHTIDTTVNKTDNISDLRRFTRVWGKGWRMLKRGGSRKSGNRYKIRIWFVGEYVFY